MPGKLGLHRFYWRDARFRSYLPPTAPFSKERLAAFLARYGTVYVKPNMAHTGIGIVKVWMQGDRYNYVLVRGQKRVFNSVQALYAGLKPHLTKGAYIVQKGIDLARIGGRPFDIRVMMMRNGRGEWAYLGMLAKVAGPGSVITNVRRGRGYATTVGQALKQSLSMNDVSIGRLEKRMIPLSYSICRKFRAYKYTSMIGIDYAVDSSGRLWIIEVNFDYPSRALFDKLKDKTMYRRIKRTEAAYKRWRARK